jgi:hypothetical protein
VLAWPADGTRLPTVVTETSVRRRFFLGQLSGKLLLASIDTHGMPDVNRNGRSKECGHPPQAIRARNKTVPMTYYSARKGTVGVEIAQLHTGTSPN